MKIVTAATALLAITACTTGSRPPRDARAQFLGTTAEPSAVIASELAFARMAKDKGTWTAFRATATKDALWPGPNWEIVQTAIKDLPDPAQPILWEPDTVIVSCDGSYALSTGPAHWPSGRKSRYSTIWQRQDDGTYKWVLDQGLDLGKDYAKPEMVAAKVADCPAGVRPRPAAARRGLAWQNGKSDDGTLAWTTRLASDCSREFLVTARRGERMEEVFRGVGAKPPVSPNAVAPVCT